jgi:hypothetical protein
MQRKSFIYKRHQAYVKRQRQINILSWSLVVLLALILINGSGKPVNAGEIFLLPYHAVQQKCQSQIAWEHIKRAAEGKPKTRLIANGCYISKTGNVYVRDDLSPSRTREVIRHELKHKDGWRH